MARTKRAKVVSLTQTRAKTREHKESFFDTVRDAANQHAYVWVFSVSNMRNAYLNEVRRLWRGSRIFFGKLRVMAKALGETPEEEIRPGLAQIAHRLRGNVGLLFTDSPPAEVLDWFSDYRRIDYARMGNKASEDIVLPAGPIEFRSSPPETVPRSLEPQLRALGMPTQLKAGVPTLLEDFSVCKKGEMLTAEKAQILKHLLVQLADFRLVPLTYWSAVGAEDEENQEEGVVVDVPLAEDDREFIESMVGAQELKGGSTKGTKRIAEAVEDDEDEDEDEDGDDDMPNEFDIIEKRDKAMMLPEDVKL
ncbi:mRNA turnover and ribosome assembly protein [Malassezia sp. CBS 17886]|nr:mRNA turnover and ribosome assembly protein [Malassezia sp. CBS 17886]